MATSAAAPRKESKYTSLLLTIASGLTAENISMIKLYFFSEGLAKQDDINEISTGSDALLVLMRGRLINSKNCDILTQILKAVGRPDLSALVKNYMCCDCYQECLDGALEENKFGSKHPNFEDLVKSSDECGKMFVDDDPESQPSSQDSQESSVSMTDEEKLKCLESCDSQDLFD